MKALSSVKNISVSYNQALQELDMKSLNKYKPSQFPFVSSAAKCTNNDTGFVSDVGGHHSIPKEVIVGSIAVAQTIAVSDGT